MCVLSHYECSRSSLCTAHFGCRTAAAKASASAGKDAKGDDLDQVSGNAEDDIGDNMAFIREHELLYGEDSLLALYGPLISDICANPSKYEVRAPGSHSLPAAPS